MFSSKKSIKIEKQLYEQLAELAQRSGYSSTEELIKHVLEREIAASDQPGDQQGDQQRDQQRAEDQLRGLGYIE